MEFVSLNISGNVAWIKLNRPEVFNSFHTEMGFEFLDCLNQVDKDQNIRCVVIQGEGKAFCAGQDLQEAIDPDGPGLHKIISERYNPIILAIRQLRKPVIAAVNGVAAGAGANIALACDIVVAAVSASFIQAFSKIGLIPDSGGTFVLPRLIGWNRAAALMITGDKVSASDALQMGMLYKVFPDEVFNSEVEQLAIKISLMPTRAIALTKKLLNQSFINSLEIQLAEELKIQLEASSGQDYKEGIAAFLEKRAPDFKGN